MDSNALRRQNAIGPGHGNSIPAVSQQNSQANESQLFASEDVNSDVVEVVISSLSNTENSVQTQVSDLTFSQPSQNSQNTVSSSKTTQETITPASAISNSEVSTLIDSQQNSQGSTI